MISLLVPSRGRPDQLIEMWHTAIETADDVDDLEMIIRVDEDDHSYDFLRSRGARGQIRWVAGPRILMSDLWNETWKIARGDIFMHCADDIRFRSPGWDLRVKYQFDKIPDRIAFIHGRDGVHDESLGTHGFLSREWTDVVGTFLPPYFSCDYNDTWLDDVAREINRKIFDGEIFTEHMHPAVGKGPMDQTHLDRLDRDRQDNNTQLYRDLASIRAQWVTDLQAKIGNSDG